MSRPRFADIGKAKKQATSLTFTPNFVLALDRVRGTKSQAVFLEEWGRQHPQIAAALKEMGDPGFTAPASRYEQLVDLLLQFYHPDPFTSSGMLETLQVAHRCIMRRVQDQPEDIVAEISTRMAALWKQALHDHGQRNAKGNFEEIWPAIEAYARYYFEVIFQEMAEGERALLQSRFRTLVRGCEAVYQVKWREERERKMLNKGLVQVIEASLKESEANQDDPEDTMFMAQGAAIRYGREQGLIGDPLSEEEQAVIAAAVQQVMQRQE
jgi:hypothetical protein